MPETPKEIRNASLAALDDGWGDLLDAAPPPMPTGPVPVPTFDADDDDDASASSLPSDDDELSTDGVPLPTPVPLRTRVPTRPVLRGIRDESQPIQVITIVRDPIEPSDGIPRAVDDGVPEPTTEIDPTPVPAEPTAIAAEPVHLAAVPVALPDPDPIARVPRHEPPSVGKAIAAKAPALATPAVAKSPAAARALPSTATPQSSGRRTLLVGASGVAALFVVGVLATRPGDDADGSRATPQHVVPAAASSAAARAAAPEPEAPAPAIARAEPVALPTAPSEPTEPAPEPVAAAADVAAPSEDAAPSDAPPSVAAAASDDPIADAQAALESGEFSRAHALAREVFRIGRDNEAMRIMATAACQLDDGVLAREAYRSLAGPRTRSEVFTLCRERGVDVRAKTDGYTPKELLAKASRMAELGDPAQAYEIARDANRTKRSAVALELMGTSACKMKSVEKAAYVAGLVGAEARQRIAAECTANGVELPAEG